MELRQRRHAEGDDHAAGGRRHEPGTRGERERGQQTGGVHGVERAGDGVGRFGGNRVQAGAAAADAGARLGRPLRRGAPPRDGRQR